MKEQLLSGPSTQISLSGNRLQNVSVEMSCARLRLAVKDSTKRTEAQEQYWLRRQGDDRRVRVDDSAFNVTIITKHE